MKLFRILSSATMIAYPLLTPAAPPVPLKALASVEATVNFCTRVDSKSADKYKEWGKRVVADMTEKELSEARKSSEYQEVYEELAAELEKIPAEKAAQGCRAALDEANK